MSLESTSAAGTSPVKPLEFKESESVEALTKLICGEMQNKLETKANEGVAQEKRRTSRSKYLRKVIQSLEDLEPDKKGVFNIEGHPKLSKIEQDLQQYEKQAKSYEEEACQLEEEACQLEEEACQLEEEACQLEAGAGASKNMKDGHSKRLAKEKKNNCRG